MNFEVLVSVAIEAICKCASRALEVPEMWAGRAGLLTLDHDKKSIRVPPDARLGVEMAASGLSWPEGNVQCFFALLLEAESTDKESHR